MKTIFLADFLFFHYFASSSPFDKDVLFDVKDSHNISKDKSGLVLLTTVSVMALLIVVSSIPSFQISDIQVQRTNVLSSFMRVESAPMDSFLEDEAEEILSVDEKLSEDDSLVECRELVIGGIENYGQAVGRMKHFLRNLANESCSRNVRIAFFGDSFIEGDILTAALRNELQMEYGGDGVGFVPFADPIAKFRGTVRQEYSGWTCYNLLKRKDAPERYKNEFFMSGYVSVPVAGAVATFRSGSYQDRRLMSSHARIFFKNRLEGVMDVVVNGNESHHYVLEQKDEIQYIDVESDSIKCLSVSLPVCNDFIGYGVFFESECGVTVDNFGLRSNSGINLLSTSAEVNSQIAAYRGYDLVVMEYGLNAMQKDVTQYSHYVEQFKKVVDYVQETFPNSAIMLLSVGDVGMKVDGQIITAPAVPAMVSGQRLVARQCDISFWDMYQRMGGSGAMKSYVENGWANKDYLHINFRGGDRLGRILFDSIQEGSASTNQENSKTII